jgi:phosphate transport system protein
MKKLVKKATSEEANKNLLISTITMKEMMSNLERIGDYATNIAEAAIYSIEGKDIRHHKIDE